MVVYILLSAGIKSVSGMDICIPCLWKTVFGFECPGCGLTTALTKLMQFNFSGAINANPLIFIIAPAILFFLMKDFKNFSNRRKKMYAAKVQ